MSLTITISEEKRNLIHDRINRLYEMCGNLNPIIYYIDGLTSQFNSIVDNDCKAFELQLLAAESSMSIYYNRNGVSKEIAESELFNHLLVYKVKDKKKSEGRYFFHIELANLFIRGSAEKTSGIEYNLSKIFNGYSVCVNSPLFFG